MPDELHDLSALYALDVLDADERARFEAHLATCDRCTEDLAGLREAASSLAFVGGPAPPAALRGRILTAARAEPSNVVSLADRRSRATTFAAVLAVAASAVAVGLGIWAATLHHSLSQERSATRVLNDPNATRLAVPGHAGTLVVAPSGEAVLTVSLPKDVRGVGRGQERARRRNVQRRTGEAHATCRARRPGDGHARAKRRCRCTDEHAVVARSCVTRTRAVFLFSNVHTKLSVRVARYKATW
jgi:anti-sigma factor RsiW